MAVPKRSWLFTVLLSLSSNPRHMTGIGGNGSADRAEATKISNSRRLVRSHAVSVFLETPHTNNVFKIRYMIT